MPREAPPDPEHDQDRSFPEARAIHERILAHPDNHLEGWVEQACFRERYDLPPFRPPRFVDGTSVAETVSALEVQLDISIEFVAYDIDRGGWLVKVDDERVFRFEQYRDDAANSVVDMDQCAFIDAVHEAARDEPYS